MKLEWDHHSDQPHVIKDKKIKQQIYRSFRWDTCKLLLTNLVFYPLCFVNYLLFPEKEIDRGTSSFFGMSINLDKDQVLTKRLIDELAVNNLLIRMPLSDIDNLDLYVKFAKQYRDKSLLINILQDRKHVENEVLLASSLEKVFDAFSPITERFQLGNAINRKKWAIFSMDEFLRFYEIGYKLRNEHFPTLKLLGSSVIDFEYYFSIRTLFNRYKIRFDQFSSLLYVDRRGAPENTQMGLDLTKKLHLMQSMLRLSRKSTNEIVITETNWPLSNTAPYAPTSENDCVSLDKQANYLVRYYLLALGSGVVKNVYWHQLIAPGYGLIDNRQGQCLKYPSFSAFKTMVKYCQGAQFMDLVREGKRYKVTFTKDTQLVEVFWLTEEMPLDYKLSQLSLDQVKQKVFDRDGVHLDNGRFVISESPIYRVTDINL